MISIVRVVAVEENEREVWMIFARTSTLDSLALRDISRAFKCQPVNDCGVSSFTGPFPMYETARFYSYERTTSASKGKQN